MSANTGTTQNIAQPSKKSRCERGRSPGRCRATPSGSDLWPDFMTRNFGWRMRHWNGSKRWHGKPMLQAVNRPSRKRQDRDSLTQATIYQ